MGANDDYFNNSVTLPAEPPKKRKAKPGAIVRVGNRGLLGGRKRGGKNIEVDLAADLDYATRLALGVCIEIMERNVPKAHRQYVRMQKVRHAAANTILNTAVRVDDQRLRRRMMDRFPALMKLISEEQKKLGIIDGTATEVSEG